MQYKNYLVSKVLLLIFFIVSLKSIASTELHIKTADSLYGIALYFENVNSDSVIYYSERAYQYAKTEENTEIEIDALLLQMKALILQGDYSNAYNISVELDNLSIPSLLPARQLELEIHIGNMYRLLGLHEKAIETLLNAQILFDKLDLNESIVNFHYYLALAYYEIGEIGRSQYFTRKCINEAQYISFEGGLISGYILYASSQDRLDSINRYYDLADQIISENLKLQFEKVILRNNQALLNKAIGNLAKSKEQYLEAISITNQYGYTEELGNLYNNYAYLLIAEEKYDSARISLDLAFQAALKVENLDLEASILDSYSDYYKTIDDYESALTYKTNSIKKRREYTEQQRIQESLLLSVVFETEEKEKEILLKENKLSRMQILFLGALVLFIAFH